jgi:hypothetical protein
MEEIYKGSKMKEEEKMEGKKTANPTRYARYHADPEYAERINKESWQYQKVALATNEEFRAQRREYQRAYYRERYATDAEYRKEANEAAEKRRKARRAKGKEVRVEEGELGHKEKSPDTL